MPYVKESRVLGRETSGDALAAAKSARYASLPVPAPATPLAERPSLGVRADTTPPFR